MDIPRGISPAAFDNYARAVRFSQLPGPDAHRLAEESFRLAIRSDTLFAPAYTGIATLEVLDAGPDASGTAEPTRCRRVVVNALRALKLDPLEAGAHTAYAWTLWRCAAAPQQAERQFRVAIERSPNDPLVRRLFAAFLGSQDRFAERLAETRHALDRDPLSPAIHDDLARCLLYLHDYPRAERLCQRALQIDPGLGSAWETLARTEAASGRWADALEAQRAADSLGGRPNARWLRLRAAVRTGDNAEAARLWRPLRALIDLGEADPLQAALACDAMGQRDEAMSWLAQACASGATTIEDLRMAPELDSLRGDTRFNALLARVQGAVAATH
jgi:tetratricopeptide (TPR) repeat protein